MPGNRAGLAWARAGVPRTSTQAIHTDTKVRCRISTFGNWLTIHEQRLPPPTGESCQQPRPAEELASYVRGSAA
jgi:hypothetical protein